MVPDDHDAWSELAAGYALSALDDADQATYLEHDGLCTVCRQLEHDFSEVIADLALTAPAVTPPPSLKASIMRAVVEDDAHRAQVIPIAVRRDTADLAIATNAGVASPPSRR